MRPIVLGRKNWIHIGSPQAGPKVTAIMSVIETCRRIKVSARDYLSAVLPGSRYAVETLACPHPNQLGFPSSVMGEIAQPSSVNLC